MKRVEVIVGSRRLLSPRIIDFPLSIPVSDELVTNREEIEILFKYPLTNKVVKKFTNPGGFTAYDVFRAVYDGYVTIYREEDEAVGDPGNIPGMLNRQQSHGPHGIWGHDIDHLYLEGFTESENGQFALAIGS